MSETSSAQPYSNRMLQEAQDYLFRGTDPRILGSEHHLVALTHDARRAEISRERASLYGMKEDCYRTLTETLGSLYHQAIKAKNGTFAKQIGDFRAGLARVLQANGQQQLGKMESMIRNIDEILNQILEPKQA